MPVEFDLPDDLTDLVYVEEEDLDNLENDDHEIFESGDDDIDPIEDKSSVSFNKHTKSLFRVNINHANTQVITGGQDDLAFIWDIATGEPIFECTGHKDSVTECSFSFDDKFVATGDMSGLIQVWNVENKNLVWCFEGDELEWLQWHHNAHVLLAGVATGDIFMWQIPQGNCKVLPTVGSKICDALLLPNGTQLIAGYENYEIRLWDLKTASVIHQLPSKDLGSSITSLVLSSDGKLVLLCGLNTGLVVLKTVDMKIATILEGSEEIECAAFYNDTDLPLVASGSIGGDVCIWDLSHQTLRHKTKLDYCVTKIRFGPNALLYVSCIDGVVYVFAGRTGELLTTLTGHQAGIIDMTTTKDFNLILTASDDGTSKVFDITKCLPSI